MASKKKQANKIFGNKRLLPMLLLAIMIGSVGTYELLMTHALTSDKNTGSNAPAPNQKTNKSSFDYGQIHSGGGWSQPAGGIFDATTYDGFSFNNTYPQQMVYQTGYNTAHVEVLSVTCRVTSWGCYQSQVNPDYFGLNRPSVFVCVNVPNGAFPPPKAMFTIKFRAKDALNDWTNWWTNSSGVAPGTCQSNITAEGFMFNTIDGSGVCDGQFEPCDRGTSPEIGNYIGFGPPKSTTGQTSGKKGTSTGQSGGGASGSNANTESNKSDSIPSTSSQGSTKQPTLNPSPFYDGKEYAAGSDPIDKTLGNISVAGRKIAHGWVYLIGVLVVTVGSIVYYYWRKHKGFVLIKR